MILPIVQYGDPVLRKKCKEITERTDSIKKLAQNMLETMREAEGIGIAAPQVGVGIRLAIVDVSHDPSCFTNLKINGEEIPSERLSEHMPICFYNPQIEPSGPEERDLEGCLSIDGIQAKVKRPSRIKATLPQLDGTTLEIEADGLLSRAIQHEVDHLNGVLFVDRLGSASKVRISSVLKKLTKH